MKCTNPKIGEMLWQYQFDLLSPEDRKRFETHTLQCDYCFSEAYSLSPVIERIKENPRPFLKVLAEPAPPGFWKRLVAAAQKLFAPVRDLPLGWQVALGSLATASIILLMFMLLRAPANLADLAQIEPYPFTAMTTMGPAEQTLAERQFYIGMEAYNKGDYDRALPHLKTAAMLDSTDAEFQFFLGVTYLLAGDATAALTPLKSAFALDPSRFEARARWYLANAYLLLEDKKKAMDELHTVMRFGKEFEKKAKQIAREIR